MKDSVLVVGPSWVGDMVMAQTLLKSLKECRPDVSLDMLAPPASLPVAERMPEVRRCIEFGVGHGELSLGYRLSVARRLRGEYTQAIVLPNSLKSALVPAFAGIPLRTGFLGEMRYFLLNDPRLLDEKRLPRMIDRFIALGDGDFAGHPALRIDTENFKRQVQGRNLDLSSPILGLCPGAEFGDAKRWPASHFAALADRASHIGMQVWIFGSPADKAVADEICDESKNVCVNLAGETSLTDAIDLISACRLVVSNDSGLMHIAAATGVEVAVVYGSTSANFTPPLSEKASILSEQLDCSPCFARTCPLGHKNCLQQLKPEKLFRLLDLAVASS